MDFALVDGTEHYRAWIEREATAPSVVGVLLPGGAAVPAPEEVMAALGAAGLPPLSVDVRRSRADAPTGWELDAMIERDGVPVAFTFTVLPSPTDDGPVPSQLDEAQRELTAASEWSIVTVTEYGDTALGDFHHHLRVVSALVPEAAAYYDNNSLSFRTADWVRRAAASPAPPPVEALFVVHAIVDTDGGVWLHTHGLDRCGTVELEIVGLDRGNFQAFGRIVNVAAARFVEPGQRPPGERIVLGRGLAVTWVPWESVARTVGPLPDGMVGGADDHVDEHATPRASLLATTDGPDGKSVDRVAPLFVLEEALDDDPVFYLTRAETDRMRILARSELGRFAQLLGRYGDDGEWGFRVKLGYPLNGPVEAGPADDCEHLWFEVHAIRGERVEATLLNEPHAVRLGRGDRGEHPLSLLSDFLVQCPTGGYGPDRLGDLVLRLP